MTSRDELFGLHGTWARRGGEKIEILPDTIRRRWAQQRADARNADECRRRSARCW
jgi:hypothetical protein